MVARSCAKVTANMATGKIEHRRTIRVKPSGLVAKTCKLFMDAKSPAIECQIIDLSSSGASVWLPRQMTLPQRFEFMHGGVKKNVFLVWQKNLRAGIGF